MEGEDSSMIAEAPWDDGPDNYDPDSFGDTYFEDEHSGPDAPGEHYLDEPSTCAECDRPVDPRRELCSDCELDEELEAQFPDAYEPVHDDVAVAYDTHIDDLAFAVVPACSRFEAIVKATFAFDAREAVPMPPTGYEGLTFELIHEADEDDIRSFIIGWGALPDAVPVASKRGLKLFHKAHNRTDWRDHLPEDAEADPDPTPNIHLYNQDGVGICRASQFVELIDGYEVPDDPRKHTKPEFGSDEEELWLVPAFTLRVTPTTAF